ncbi:hypothetical protein [Desulfosarcina ovata]|uniref:hypothetical protein n=1 Tax=Desulfosarcina ovata TaxID=83564 RepID=UPI0012D33873|nr:hypothetical protein [Desulfosarcina ovata]
MDGKQRANQQPLGFVMIKLGVLGFRQERIPPNGGGNTNEQLPDGYRHVVSLPAVHCCQCMDDLLLLDKREQ